jgi:hypothetical protein
MSKFIGMEKTISKDYTYCEVHGRLNKKYMFCPYCGKNLSHTVKFIHELPDDDMKATKITKLAHKEAKCAAWGALGVHGNVAYYLASKVVFPVQLKTLIEGGLNIKGIGPNSLKVIKNFTTKDSDKFEQIYFQLKLDKSSWPYELAKWYYSIRTRCNHYEYRLKKQQLKRAYANKIKG